VSNFFIFSIYIVPTESSADFHVTLDELSVAIRAAGGNCIVTGDFNAKSGMSGSPELTWCGSVLERWAAELDLRIINVGASPICVRHNDLSIVDLTW